MIKNIFITGALGLVGKELIKLLLKEEKYNLLCVDLKKQFFRNQKFIKENKKKKLKIYKV